MMVKIIAAFMGWQVAGLFGAMIGFYIGHFLIEGLADFLVHFQRSNNSVWAPVTLKPHLPY